MTASAAPALSTAVGPPKRGAADQFFKMLCFSAATTLLAALAGVVVALAIGGWPAFKTFGFGFFTTTTWNPVTEVFGGLGPITGTILTALISMLFALPTAFGVSVYLVEFAPRVIRQPVATAIQLLAGIPSVVFGMWGLFVFAPFFALHVQLPLMSAIPEGSWLEKLVQGVPNGANLFTASIILAIMILPYMAAVFRELFLSVPPQLRESAYGLGATPVEAVWKVLMPYIRRSAIGAIMLGLGRALGETMAVTFIIGNTHDLPKSLFDSGSTIASTIANEFAEATSALHTSALIALGLVLFLITFAVLGVARAMLGSLRTY